MREPFTAAARLLASLLIVPLLATYWLAAALIGHDRSLEGSSELLSLIPALPGNYLRRPFLARVLAGCHPTASIGFGTCSPASAPASAATFTSAPAATSGSQPSRTTSCWPPART
jgi:hypothetical protein